MNKRRNQRLLIHQKMHNLFFDDRGVSQIIITIIMIVLVLTAVGVVWVVVQNILDQGLSDVTLGAIKINLDIESVKITDTGLDVKVKRNSGEANLVGINFIVSDGENTQVFEEETDMKELATQTFSLDYSGIVKSVEIAPVLANDEGKEKVYDSVEKKELTLEQSLTGLGIVSWWKLDGDATDSIGENDGEIFGDTDCSVEGVYGNACEFSASLDESIIMNVDLSAEGSLIAFIQGTLTGNPSENMYPVGWRTRHSLLGPSNGVNPRSGIITSGDSGSVDYYYDWGNQNFYDGNWHQYVIIWDSVNFYLYRDGEMIDSPKSHSGHVFPKVNASFSIGGGWSGNYGTHDGKIDEVMVFDKALNEEQVNWLYEADLS